MKSRTKIISLLLSLIMVMSIFSVVSFNTSAAEIDTTGYTDIRLGETKTVVITEDNKIAYFRFIPEEDMVVTFYSIGESDTYGCLCDENMNWLDFDSTNGQSNNFRITYRVTAGQIYYFTAEYGNDADIGSFNVILEQTGEWGYRFFNDGTVEIIRYYGTETELVIPSEIDGYVVTSIGELSFRDNDSLQSVIIPDSVKTIGYAAFARCENLSDITIPDFVNIIGAYAFNDTAWYHSQSDGVVYLGKAVYSYKGFCPEVIEISDGTTSISAHAFDGRLALKTIIIPDSVQYIGSGAFENCFLLQNVKLPESLRTIDTYAFSACMSLTDIEIPDSVISIRNFAFSSCSSLNKLTMGKSVEYIGQAAFISCKNLSSVRIPSEVKTIGFLSFGYLDYGNKIETFTIYGYNGTAAERYANSNGFTFIALDDAPITIEDEETHISVILEGVDAQASLQVDELSSEEISIPNAKTTAAYNITLIKDGTSVQPDNTVIVKIPCEKSNARVYRVEENNAYTDMNAEYTDGYLSFTTDHLSIYIVAEKKEQLLGDVDGDGEVTIIDATCIQRKLASIPTAKYIEEAADADGDGEVTIIDATAIQRHLAQLPANERIGKAITV